VIVEGHIREKDSGNLIQGAKVTLTVGPGRPGIAPPGNDLEIAILRTGSRGLFRYQEDRSRLPAGQTLAIHVEHPGYEPQRVFQAVADQVHVDIELEPHSPDVTGSVVVIETTTVLESPAADEASSASGLVVVSGHVRDQATGEPIDDAIVTLAVGSHEIVTLETHRDGSFRHQEGPPTKLKVGETLMIRVEHPGYSRWQRSPRIESERFNIDIGLAELSDVSHPWWRELIERIPAWAWMVFGVFLITAMLAFVLTLMAPSETFKWLSVAGTAIAGVMITLPIAFPSPTAFQLEAFRAAFSLAVGALGGGTLSGLMPSRGGSVQLVGWLVAIVIALIAYWTDPTGRIAKEAKQQEIATPLPAGGFWQRFRNYLKVALASTAVVGAGIGVYFWLTAVVPHLQGRTVAEAQNELTEVGLKVGETAEIEGGTPGSIVRTDPSAGERVLKRTAVTLVVGKGIDYTRCLTGSVQAARDGGDAGAMFSLGTVCLREGGEEGDTQKVRWAIQLLEAAAARGDARAMLSIGLLFDPENLRFDADNHKLVSAEDRRFQQERENPLLACQRYVEAAKLGDAATRDIAIARLRRLEPSLESHISRSAGSDPLAEKCLRDARTAMSGTRR
jgi:PASTA domain